MAVFSNAPSDKAPARRRRWFVGLSLLFVGLIFAVGALLWQAAELSSMAAVSEQVARLKSSAGAIRLLLIGLLALLWPKLIDRVIHYGRVDAARRSELQSLRWRVVTWLLIMELMIGQDLFSRFIQMLRGAIT